MGKSEGDLEALARLQRGPYITPTVGEPRAIEDRSVAFAGSDQKRSGYDSTGVCWLCIREAELRLSHTLPRWSYQAIGRVEPGTAGAYRGNPELTFVSTDGDKHYLLCSACEHLLGKSERALKEFCLATPSMLRRAAFAVSESAPGTFLVAGDGLNMVHHALLGIVYKLAIARSSSVVVEPARLESLRHAVLSGDLVAFHPPAAHKYFMSPASGDAEPWGSQGSVSGQVGEESFVVVCIGGFDWIVPIGQAARHATPWTITVLPLFVQWVLHHSWDLEDLGELIAEWGTFLSARKRADWCPCGSRREFGDCCLHGWLEGLLALTPANDP